MEIATKNQISVRFLAVRINKINFVNGSNEYRKANLRNFRFGLYKHLTSMLTFCPLPPFIYF